MVFMVKMILENIFYQIDYMGSITVNELKPYNHWRNPLTK